MKTGRDIQILVVISHPDVRFFRGTASVLGFGHDEIALGGCLPGFFLEGAVDGDGLVRPDGPDDPGRRSSVLGLDPLFPGGETQRQDNE